MRVLVTGSSRVSRFVFTSTTSVFGRAMSPGDGKPATWITEDVVPIPKNIYGATKRSAEDIVDLVHRDHELPVVILRTSRFFAEQDDVLTLRTTTTTTCRS
jgi:UDP-glucose 4-epimerase